MAILKPDKAATLGSVTVNEYLLTKHNPNRIMMPSVSMEGKIIGVTIHNTSWITTASGTTPAEQYTRATVNGNINDVRVHYYIDNTCALLKKYNLSIDHLYTHWLNVRDGKSGSVDYLNTAKNLYKTCPLYILDHSQ